MAWIKFIVNQLSSWLPGMTPSMIPSIVVQKALISSHQIHFSCHYLITADCVQAILSITYMDAISLSIHSFIRKADKDMYSKSGLFPLTLNANYIFNLHTGDNVIHTEKYFGLWETNQVAHMMFHFDSTNLKKSLACELCKHSSCLFKKSFWEIGAFVPGR